MAGAKDIVKEYYSSGAYRDPERMARFLHDDVQIDWYSTQGYRRMGKDDLIGIVREMQSSYADARLDISHLVAENDTVASRYSHYVYPIESPNEEMLLAHFSVIWEVKDKRMYRGFVMSQLG